MLKLNELPKLGEALECGTFAGITTIPDGTHCAVVLLPDRKTNIKWKAAMDWAKALDAELPSRPVAALLFANVKGKLSGDWHWTRDEDGASYAWLCYFGDGDQEPRPKSYEGAAVAVRMIPIVG